MSGPAYFVDHRQGEVNELKRLLRDPKIDKDVKRKTEVMTKVIAFQTQGIDVSGCFSEMVMAAGATKNPILKKMVYHYLCTYAQQRSDLALLAINTLRKDCRNDDPMVRGLALRSLCSLRLPNLEEYVQDPIRSGLKDPSPYVRKTAAMGVTKLFRFVPQSVRDSDLVDLLYSMLRDQDTQVIANVICTLNEVLSSEGKMAINHKIVMYLLNRLHEFSEWGQCTVLELLARYTPSSDDVMFDIMNLLESRLQHANSAVVLGACTVFLNMTRNHPPIFQQVFERIKNPLLTLMGGGVELGFALLSHIKVLVQTSFPDPEKGDGTSISAASVFADSHKYFFIGFNDPACVKTLKLDILVHIVDAKSASEIVSEVAEYITDVDTAIACKAIESLGHLAIRLPLCVDEVVANLLSFLKLGIPYVTAQTIIVVKDILRKYPERYEEILPMLEKSLIAYVSSSLAGGSGLGAEVGADSSASGDLESNSRLAIIWMLGEWGELIDEAPYLLELYVSEWEEEPSREVRLELLSSSMRLFFKRPPEMQRILGKCLAVASKDVSRVEVRDKALLYYRLLQADVHEAARVVNSPKLAVDRFMELEDEHHSQLRRELFSQFNSLSVIFGQSEETFTQQLKGDLSDDEDDDTADGAADHLLEGDQDPPAPVQADVDLDEPDDLLFDQPPVQHTPAEQAVGAADMGLDLDSFLGGDQQPQAPALQLVDQPVCSPQEFQAKWTQLPVSAVLEMDQVSLRTVAQINAGLGPMGLKTMASGAVGGTVKFYAFGQTPNQEFVFVECIVAEQSGSLRATIKCDQPNHGEPLRELVHDAFAM